MPVMEPVAELDARFSAADASATPWARAQAALEQAEVFWISTVRPDGRPHVTPLLAVWLEGALHFCTGAGEQKARNLARNPHCSLTTGCNSLAEGLDLVVEGVVAQVADDAKLRRLAALYESKYGSEWHFDVRDGAFQHGDESAQVFEVAPVTAFGFGKGKDTFSQTRWRFGS
jgi:nitroimidazol reductase NimA-like FMN-containing flavoprotein (pyridoxamine 5'-phosphate oxidase superfamily)